MVSVAERSSSAATRMLDWSKVAEDLPPLDQYEKVLNTRSVEKHPMLEEYRDDFNPKWVLVKILSRNPKLAWITNADENRSIATTLVLPDGVPVFDNVWGDPRFKMLCKASAGDDILDLHEFDSWLGDKKECVQAWSSYNHAHPLRTSVNSRPIQPKKFNGVNLPTSDTIHDLVLQIVNDQTSLISQQK